MSHPIAQSARHWIAGLATAALGCILVRVVAPELETVARRWVTVAGEIIALAGIIITACGVKRRVTRLAGEEGEVSAAPAADHDSA